MINILVLMAGRGKRFSDVGYGVPKPMIPIKNKTILEWTTESCPYIVHGGGKQLDGVNLYFAVLQEHIDNGLSSFLEKTYGTNITIIPFEQITKGNLETARIAADKMKVGNCRLLILDADNKYFNNGLCGFIDSLPSDLSTMAICCFTPQQKIVPNKWSNARVRNGFALELREKDDLWTNHPSLIGVFYFSSVDQFKNYADHIMLHLNPVGFEDSKEFYMSMIPSHHAKIGQPVYVHMVSEVVPLGTPEDVYAFAKENV